MRISTYRFCVKILWLVFAAMTATTVHGYEAQKLWTNTATDTGLLRGDPAVITWGIVPDGTPIREGTFSGGLDSNFIATFDSRFGAGAGGSDLTQRPWFDLISHPFNRWTELSGLALQYEPNDDGIQFGNLGNSSGLLGTRADIRLAGADLGQLLAAIGFRNDVRDILVTTNPNTRGGGVFYDPFANYRTMRNVTAAATALNLGLSFTSPNSDPAIMSNSLLGNFDGPQFDDVLGLHRLFGDRHEKSNARMGNDSADLATTLGMFVPGDTVELGTDGSPVTTVVPTTATDFVSIDGASDTDFYSFSLAQSTAISVDVTPTGPSYLTGPQGGAATIFDASRESNLNVSLIDSDGETELSFANSPLGQTNDIGITLNPGDYYLRIQGAQDRAQMYSLRVDAAEAIQAGDFDGDGNYDCADVDSLVMEIASGGIDLTFDLNGDGEVDRGDLTAWLAEAGDATLASGNSFLPGDANLDGSVDASDFNVWNENKFTMTAAWCRGDFDANGAVDASDFNVWNENKFTSANDATVVPEPSILPMLALAFFFFHNVRRIVA